VTQGTAAGRHRELGLTDGEFELITDKLGREPNEVELAVFSLMWSEHCGYKHSRPLLKTLPSEGGKLVLGPGENAGAVAVGGGLACAFKVESHNHPSAVEPFQGAATGVGGILRDVFAVGARPIAILDSLRFGEPARSARSRYLLDRAVAGIGHYGNSIGVATVGGELYFESSYEQNCLVNAMCLGLIETERLIRSAAAGVGNVVVLFGARTGRDGIGGASVLASAELGEGDAAKRPSVQIGDPFEEKRLLECSLELLDRGLLVALQDLGAAGLTSSSAEMAAKGEVGIDIDVRRVPLREADMEPFEIMISESQERMLCVVEPARLDEVLERCARWEVKATAIGEVTDSRRLRVFDGETQVGDMPVTALVDECPVYELSPLPPATPLYPAPPRSLADEADAGATLLALLRSANLASRRWAFEQYDCLVGSRTVRRPGQADAAVLLLAPEAPRDDAPRAAIATSIDGNGRRVACDPYRGAVEAVLECSANLACVGAEPLGMTNCLNFGNPEKPHIAWQLTRAVAGLGDACRALGVPVVGGNVSLYNEGGGGPIFPTPVVGMVGELPDVRRAGRIGFAEAGDAVALIAAGSWAPSRTGSELAKLRGEAPEGELPAADLGELRAVHAAVRQAVRSGALRSAHDVAEGGVAVALAECCLAGGLGASVDLRGLGAEALFGEGPGAFVVSGPSGALRAFGSAARVLGEVGGDTLVIAGELEVPLAALAEAHAGGLADLLG
jgi:phosphoribosylformylglycinamidine synthase